MEIPGYDIIGELAVDRDTRRYLARRTEDGADVLITVVGTVEGDEGNALSHLASDVKLLSAQPHHGVLRVLDGIWVGDEFAVVSQRPPAPTLEELLIRRDEEFPFVRIATVLRDINAALVWARDHGVVHRAIRLENVFVEPGSDRTTVSFSVRPLALTNMPSEAEDSRTIAGLATAMFTRGRRAEKDVSLAAQRPGLPTSVVEQTERLLGKETEGDAPLPDVTSYIASIAMAEALKAAEDHLERNRHLIEEQQREHQAQLERERAEHAEALAKERQAHAREREAHQRAVEAHARDQEVLRIERESHERDRELLRRERAQYDREINAILAQKARQRTREGIELVARGWRRRPMWTRRWMASPNWKWIAPIAAGAALVVVTAFALTRGGDRPDRLLDSADGVVAQQPAESPPMQVAAATTPTTDTTAALGASPVPDSTPAAPDSTPAVSGVPRAFISSVMARAESLSALRSIRSEPRREPAPPARPPQRRLDTIFTAPTLPPRDTIARDTMVRRDSMVPRDTILRPDTVARRDSLRSPLSRD